MAAFCRIAFALALAFFLAPTALRAMPSPLARYAFDDGTANDSSGNALNGVLIGGAQIVIDTNRPGSSFTNKVLLLNGVSGAAGTNQTYVNITDPLGKLNFAGGNATVAAWVRVNLTKNHNAVFSQGEWRRGASMTIKGDTVPANELWAGRTSPAEGYNSFGGVPVQQWMHIAITWTVVDADTEITFFTNGIATGTFTMTGTLQSPVNGSAIGREWRDSTPTDCRWVFNGEIDDMQVFNAALSSTDIYQLFSGTPPPPPPPPTNVPPAIVFVNPPAGFTTRSLTQADVVFSKAVQGVNAGDLLVNGSAATNVNALSTTHYLFAFPQPVTGPVVFNWATNHGITDLTNLTNPFGGSSWAVTLNPSLPQAGVVINEMYYHTDPKTDKDEFIEVYNDSESTNDISNWRFSSGIGFTFPPGTFMPPNSYLVITENKPVFDAIFGAPSLPHPVTAFGEWTGGLANDGERIRLVNGTGLIMSELTYSNAFPWPIGADGSGPSMERINAWVDSHLGGSWRSSNGKPTPGAPNSVFATNAPPHVEAVSHSPLQPVSGQNITVTARVLDPDGVGPVTLQYQVVAPGNYIPAYLAKSTGLLLSNPNDPLTPNPAYLTNWISISMHDDGLNGDIVGNDGYYVATIPASTNRTLIRYRIVVTDALGASVRVPYTDDPSLNWACFIYNGTPPYVADTASVLGTPHTYPSNIMASVPVYQLLTASNDFSQCVAYNTADRIPVNNYDARESYNWTGTFVYDGEVYDNIGYRLGRRNARYSSYVSGVIGKRNFKFLFNDGHLAHLRDNDGNLYPQPTKELMSHNMVGSRSNPYWGLDQAANNLMWNMYGVPAPNTHWFELRVVQGIDEQPAGANGQYFGDYYGLLLAVEDYDSHYLDERNLDKGNIYKLMSFRTNGLDVQKYQARDSVTNAMDFSNIVNNLRPERTDDWLLEYVNYSEYYQYKAIVEAVRDYDVQPNLAEHLKNREYYFAPSPTNSLGQLWILPQDSDTTWGPSFNGGVDFKKQAMWGYNGATPRPNFIRDFKNDVREIRDLMWTPEQVALLLDPLQARIQSIVSADRDRWTGSPAAAGSQSNPPVADVVLNMKNFAFKGGSWVGGTDVNIWDPNSKDTGISGLQGRGAYLDSLQSDPAIPAMPVIVTTGSTNFPVNFLTFSASSYSGTNAFAAWKWRLAEVTLTNELPLPFGVHPHFELLSTWESSEITDPNNRSIYVPATAVEAGHRYRVRARAKDASGRWSHWSAPIEFVPGAAAAPAWPLQLGPYTLTNWDGTSPGGTYPPYMLFYQVTNSSGDPKLTNEMDSLWTLPYNLTNRSRINGLGVDGFSFINTGNTQTNAGAGYVGAAVLALNTSGKDNIRVSWTGGTVVTNDRICGIRLQYRVGTNTTFTDVLDPQGNPVEYVRNPVQGHSTNLGPVTLPPAAANQPYVQLRWKYYFISGNNNARPQLRVDDINVTTVDRPQLAPIADRQVHAGQTVQLNATIINNPNPPLTFSLSNAPAGATINPTNGAFAWSAVNVPVPGTNSVTIGVSDTSVPPLTDAKTFSIIVNPPPQFRAAISDGNGNVSFTFDSLSGQWYQLQYKDNLDDPAWTTLGSPVPGNGNTITLSDVVSTGPQRFYRLVVLP